ncbi:hypothetical protein VTL71DRAFT_1776 [Oculimacula yallundae]|uniref:Xylanolytic transcriptional activator regulatory domain-containing protein n=1 Tax=Oculimacula yallundae TaxID=86028 RepID=A0ABR4CDL1_9HELO
MRKKRRPGVSKDARRNSPGDSAAQSVRAGSGLEGISLFSNSASQILDPNKGSSENHISAIDDLQSFNPVEVQCDSAFGSSGTQLQSSTRKGHDLPTGQGRTVTTFIGRSHYITPDIYIDEASARAYPHPENDDLSATSMKTLELWKSFELPQRATSQSLFDAYLERCYPWAPVIRQQDLAGFGQEKSSLLLKQSIFVAGSRVTSGPGVIAYASTAEFYERAKALFWQSYEKDPLIVIASTIILQWYNPDGPEHVTFDGSGFWLQIAVGLSRQVGLHKESILAVDSVIRRRLWWTLVARDCLLSAGQGRPRAISLEDCDVKAPCLADFPESPKLGELFISYVDICLLLASLTECCSQKQVPLEKRLYLENSLFKWSRTLPDDLRIGLPTTMSGNEPAPYNLNARQLHLPYFTTVAMLTRMKSAQPAPSPATILASSFVAGIFEDILARDQQNLLSSIFTFYILAAGVALASVRRYPTLWASAQQDLDILQTALDQLGQRWASARGAKRALQIVIRQSMPSVTSREVISLPRLTPDDSLLLEGFPHTLCRLWQPYQSLVNGQAAFEQVTSINNSNEATSGAPDVPLSTTFYDPVTEDLENLQYDGVGNWLFGDWGNNAMW